MDSDSLKQLEYFSSPTILGEELGPIKEYLASGGAESDLEDAERFMIKLATMSVLALQLKAFALSLSWTGKVSEYYLQLKQINQASTLLMKSSSLKRFYALLLTIGNFLNYGTNKAASHGFALQTFAKVRPLTPPITNLRQLLVVCVSQLCCFVLLYPSRFANQLWCFPVRFPPVLTTRFRCVICALLTVARPTCLHTR